MKHKYTNQKNHNVLWWTAACVALVLLAGLVIWLCHACGTQKPSVPPDTTPTQVTQNTTESRIPSVMENKVELNINLGYGLTVTEAGSYTGAYVEDGSNEFVSGVLMLRVTNTGEQDIQYAEITVALTEGQANFTLSTLPAGETVILLEQTRMQWDTREAYAYAVMENVVIFAEPLSLQEDTLKLQLLNGGLNVINVSDRDITGEIVIYYKNAQDGLYYGGITYRVRLENGLRAGEIKQIMSEHFSATGSEIVFVTIG